MALLKNDEKRLTIVPGATHLFEEPGKLAGSRAGRWMVFMLSQAPKID
jgi:hypothetical protein